MSEASLARHVQEGLDPAGPGPVDVLVGVIAARLGIDRPIAGELDRWLNQAAQLEGAVDLVEACRWLLCRPDAESERQRWQRALEAERQLRAHVARAVSGLGAVGETPVSSRISAALSALGGLLGADRCCAVLWADDDEGSQSWGALHGEGEVTVPGPLGDDALRGLFLAEVPVSMADVAATADPVLRRLAQRLGSAALILVPAWVNGVCAGIVSFEGFDVRPGWATVDGELLRTVAQGIFQALERHRDLRRLQLLSLVAEYTRDVVFVRHGVTGELLYVNQAFERMTGVPPASVRTNFEAWLERFEPEDQARFLAEFPTSLTQGGTIEFQMRTSDQRMPWMASRLFSLPDREPPVLVGVVEDISDRKACERMLPAQTDSLDAQVAAGTAEQDRAVLRLRLADTGREDAVRELQASETRFRALVEALPATVLIVRGSQIVYASPTAGQPIARSAEDLIGRDLSAVLSGFGVSVDDLLAQARHPAQVQPVRQTLTFGTEGSATARLDVSIVRLEQSPEPSLVVLAFDVTDRDRSVASAREALDRIGSQTGDQAMIELSAAFAHELNQPLAALSFFLDAVSVQLAAPRLDMDPQNGLRLAAEQASRAGEIVKRLRALFTRQMPDRVVVPVRELAEWVCALYRDPADRKRIHIQATVEPPDLVIFADLGQIKLTLAHLVRNAIHAFGADKGEKREVEVGARRTEGGVEIWVRDTAPPMDHEVRDRVFSSFLGTRSRGIGIGIYLVKRIVEAHGGTFSLSEGDGHKAFRSHYPQVPDDRVHSHH